MTPHAPDVGPAGYSLRILAVIYRCLFGHPADPARHYPGRASW
jgi:hypothetical protein